MCDDTPYHDADGLPHEPFDCDIDGVPFCGQDGEDWPCETVRGNECR